MLVGDSGICFVVLQTSEVYGLVWITRNFRISWFLEVGRYGVDGDREVFGLGFTILFSFRIGCF